MTLKIETFTGKTTEIFADAPEIGMSVTVYKWANGEGISLMVHGRGPECPLRMAGSFRWEEAQLIAAALAAAQAV